MSIQKRRRFLGTVASLGAVVATLGASGCGFQLRQAPQLQFQKLWAGGSSGVLNHLRRYLRQTKSSIIIVSNPLEAEVLLDIVSEENVEAVVGQTPSGQIREKQLRTKVIFKLWVQGQDPEETRDMLEQYRESSYSETLALAKSDEEALLYDDMRKSIAEQLLWRLSAMRPKASAVQP